MAEITFKHIKKTYGDKKIFSDLSISFPSTGLICITGPSGTGKTTLIRLLLGLEKPDSGELHSDASFSVVFQEDRLLPWANVLDNVLFPSLNTRNIDKGNINETSSPDYTKKAMELLNALGLGDELNSYPKTLSGGMSRRVAIARALLLDTNVYIMDEPTKGLDEDTRKSVMDVIRKYTKNRLLILITHNQDETDGAVVINLS